MKIAILCLVSIALFSCSVHAGGGFWGGDLTSSVSGLNNTMRIQLQALGSLLDLSYVGIKVSNECLSKNVSDDIIQGLCRYINAIDTARFGIVSNSLHQNFNVTYEPTFLNTTGGSMDTASATSSVMFWQRFFADLSSLNGEEFETQLLHFLVLYDGVGIASSLPCAQSAGNKEILDICLDSIETYSAELIEVRAYLCGRYNVCEVELTAEETSLALNALNDAGLGIGTISQQPAATATAPATAPAAATATAPAATAATAAAPTAAAPAGTAVVVGTVA